MKKGDRSVQDGQHETGSRARDRARPGRRGGGGGWSRRKADVLASEGKLQDAKGVLEQAQDELRTKSQLQQRNADIVAAREIEKLQTLVATTAGRLRCGGGGQAVAQTRLTAVLPAQKASAEAELAAAQVELEKMTTYAAVDGRVDQFVLRVGDIVQPAPVTRAAGILIPEGAGESRLFAGFNQIEAQVLKVGMIAEATCISKPMTIIPLVVTQGTGCDRRRPDHRDATC